MVLDTPDGEGAALNSLEVSGGNELAVDGEGGLDVGAAGIDDHGVSKRGDEAHGADEGVVHGSDLLELGELEVDLDVAVGDKVVHGASSSTEIVVRAVEAPEVGVTATAGDEGRGDSKNLSANLARGEVAAVNVDVPHVGVHVVLLSGIEGGDAANNGAGEAVGTVQRELNATVDANRAQVEVGIGRGRHVVEDGVGDGGAAEVHVGTASGGSGDRRVLLGAGKVGVLVVGLDDLATDGTRAEVGGVNVHVEVTISKLVHLGRGESNRASDGRLGSGESDLGRTVEASRSKVNMGNSRVNNVVVNGVLHEASGAIDPEHGAARLSRAGRGDLLVAVEAECIVDAGNGICDSQLATHLSRPEGRRVKVVVVVVAEEVTSLTGSESEGLVNLVGKVSEGKHGRSVSSDSTKVDVGSSYRRHIGVDEVVEDE